MRLRKLSPGKGYRSDYLWLPRRYLTNADGVKHMLTLYLPDAAAIYAWDETKHHLVVPREFIPPSAYPSLAYPVEDITPTHFPAVDFVVHSEPRDRHQRIGIDSLVASSGLLCLAPGMGKTVIALHALAAVGMPGLVVVDTEDLMHQWRARIAGHTSLHENDVGWIQGSRWDWECPITVAMIHTLVRRIQEIPEELRRHFGVVIYDEAHILGAREFNKTAHLGYGFRWGLTATPQRRDGAELLYQYHLGEILYESSASELQARVAFVQLDTQIPKNAMKRLERGGDLNLALVVSWLAEHPTRNAIILQYLQQARAEDRIILLLSDRKKQLHSLREEYMNVSGEEAGLIVHEVRGDQRQAMLNDYPVVFAITGIARQGLDRPDLDTVFVVTPFHDKYRWRHILGRIERTAPGKQEPLAVYFEDVRILPCRHIARKLRRALSEYGYSFEVFRW